MYVLVFCHLFSKRNKDGVSSHSSEEIKEMFAAGDMDKTMQAVKLFDVVPLFLPRSSAQVGRQGSQPPLRRACKSPL